MEGFQRTIAEITLQIYGPAAAAHEGDGVLTFGITELDYTARYDCCWEVASKLPLAPDGRGVFIQIPQLQGCLFRFINVINAESQINTPRTMSNVVARMTKYDRGRPAQ